MTEEADELDRIKAANMIVSDLRRISEKADRVVRSFFFARGTSICYSNKRKVYEPVFPGGQRTCPWRNC